MCWRTSTRTGYWASPAWPCFSILSSIGLVLVSPRGLAASLALVSSALCSLIESTSPVVGVDLDDGQRREQVGAVAEKPIGIESETNQ